MTTLQPLFHPDTQKILQQKRKCREINVIFHENRNSIMKRIMLLLASAMIGITTTCSGADGLGVSIEPSRDQFTSESIPFRVVFTNTTKSKITFPEPIRGKNLAFFVFADNQKGGLLARSGVIKTQLNDGGTPPDSPKRISVDPGHAWKTEYFDLFKHTSPPSMISTGQTVRVTVTYSLKDDKYEDSILVSIPLHDLTIMPEYISSEKALELARSDFVKKMQGNLGVYRDVVPSVQCVNGVYRVVYAHPNPPKTRGCFDVVIKVDATTGNVTY